MSENGNKVIYAEDAAQGIGTAALEILNDGAQAVLVERMENGFSVCAVRVERHEG